MPEIFLSYARDDQEVARRFAQGFEREGLGVWWDQALNPGEAFDQVTEEALASASAVVVLWSKTSVSSRWVRAEATQANATNRLVPVMIEPCTRPIMFELTHTADLSHWKGKPDDPAWQGFITGLRRFIERRTGTGSTGTVPVLAARAAQEPAPRRSAALARAVRLTTARTGSWLRRSGGRLALTALVVAAAALVAWSVRPGVERHITRFTIDMPATTGTLAISPDGRRIVYTADGYLWSRRLDQDQATLVPDSEGGVVPFFSPDGRSMGYITLPPDPSRNELKAFDFATGTTRVLAGFTNVPAAMGSWDDRGHIVLGLQSFGALLRVPAVGGVPEEAVSLREETGVAWMDVLPGGEWVLFTSTPRNQVNWSDANIVAQNLSTGERRLIVKGGHYPRYLPTGHLLFARGGSLHAVAFDARRVATRGREVPVVQGVATNEANGYAPYAVSPSDGTLIYLAGQSVGLIANLRSVVRVDRDGNARPISAEPRVYGGARASPDGTSLAVEVTDADKRVHIWVMDVESGTAAQLTFDGDENRFPVWTADGREVIYVSQRGQEYGLWRMSADGTGQPRRILTGSDALVPTDVYGSTLIYQDRGAGEERDLFALDLDGDGKPRVLLSTPDDEAGARVSPDGAWLAYTSTPGGGSTTQRRVMVRPWPDPAAGGQRAISEGLGSGSVWSPAGDEIYYMVATSPIPLISTRLSRTGTTLMPGARRKLFDILGSFEFTRTGRALGYGWAFDVMPDTGEIIAVVSGTLQSSAAGGPGAPDRKLHVVLNWTEELKRLVPTD